MEAMIKGVIEKKTSKGRSKKDTDIASKNILIIGAGIAVLEAARRCAASGLELLDIICGYERLIVIDSINTEGGQVGELHRLDCSDLDPTVHSSARHQINFATTLEVGRRLHMEVPEAIAIYAIEIKDATTFREGCTPEVERAIPGVVETIIEEEKLRAI